MILICRVLQCSCAFTAASGAFSLRRTGSKRAVPTWTWTQGREYSPTLCAVINFQLYPTWFVLQFSSYKNCNLFAIYNSSQSFGDYSQPFGDYSQLFGDYSQSFGEYVCFQYTSFSSSDLLICWPSDFCYVYIMFLA